MFVENLKLKIMKLELKHLAAYLPYKLEFIYNNDCVVEKNKWLLVSLNKRELEDDFFATAARFDYKNHINSTISLIKPILRPLSDLTKEITHNGQTFVPMERLEELFYGFDFHNDDKLSILHSEQDCAGCTNHTVEINQVMDILDKLHEWHFDIYGLIEKCLAIPK